MVDAISERHKAEGVVLTSNLQLGLSSLSCGSNLGIILVR